MPQIDSLHSVLVEELRDIYDAEKRLTKAIPKLARAATNQSLKTALDAHLKETRGQITRLESVFKTLGEPARGKPCKGIQGLIKEGDEHAGEDYQEDSLRDAVIIGAAQRVEHYEMAAYGTAMAHARHLGLDKVVDTLKVTLDEEKAADDKLTEIAENVVNLKAETVDDTASGNGAARSTSRTRSRAKTRKGRGRIRPVVTK